MCRKILILATVFLTLIGCQKVPDEVKGFDTENKTNYLSLSEIVNLNNQKLELVIDNKLHINANIKVPNTGAINSYKMTPKNYDKEDVLKSFEMSGSNFDIVQGGFYDVNDKKYEPVVLKNKNFSIYIDNKRGQLFLQI